MPTKQKRVYVPIDEELELALKVLAIKYSLSVPRIINIILNEKCFPEGRSPASATRKPKIEKRGGKRPGAGRPKKSDKAKTGGKIDE